MSSSVLDAWYSGRYKIFKACFPGVQILVGSITHRISKVFFVSGLDLEKCSSERKKEKRKGDHAYIGIVSMSNAVHGSM